MASNKGQRRADPLAMQIYAALLGNVPKVARNPQTHSRLKLHVRVETSLRTASPFRNPGFRETLERAAADAITALSDAGERLRRSRAKVNATRGVASGKGGGPSIGTGARPKPIVLIGPAAIRGAQRFEAARQARRSAAA